MNPHEVSTQDQDEQWIVKYRSALANAPAPQSGGLKFIELLAKCRMRLVSLFGRSTPQVTASQDMMNSRIEVAGPEAGPFPSKACKEGEALPDEDPRLSRRVG